MSDSTLPARALLFVALLSFGCSALADTALVDPMRPPPRAAGDGQTPGPVLLLTYTRIAGEQREALIGEQLVREGDAIAGARVERIERGAVHLRRGSNRQILTLAAQGPRSARPSPEKDIEDEE